MMVRRAEGRAIRRASLHAISILITIAIHLLRISPISTDRTITMANTTAIHSRSASLDGVMAFRKLVLAIRLSYRRARSLLTALAAHIARRQLPSHLLQSLHMIPSLPPYRACRAHRAETVARGCRLDDNTCTQHYFTNYHVYNMPRVSLTAVYTYDSLAGSGAEARTGATVHGGYTRNNSYRSQPSCHKDAHEDNHDYEHEHHSRMNEQNDHDLHDKALHTLNATTATTYRTDERCGMHSRAGVGTTVKADRRSAAKERVRGPQDSDRRDCSNEHSDDEQHGSHGDEHDRTGRTLWPLLRPSSLTLSIYNKYCLGSSVLYAA